MKKIFRFYSVCVATLVLLVSSSRGSSTDTIPTKEINKTYSLKNNEKLHISNAYGNVKIQTWVKNQVSILIRVHVKAASAAAGKSAMDRISVVESFDDNSISCKTVFSDADSPTSGDTKATVDYFVQLPSPTPLKVVNQFGDISIGDYDGPLQIQLSNGNFYAGKIKDFPLLNLTQGSINVGRVQSGNLNANGFGKLLIDGIDGKVNANFNGGDSVRVGLTNELTSFNINAEHIRTVNLAFSQNLKMDMKLNTNFSLINNKTGVRLELDTLGPKKEFNHTPKKLHKPATKPTNDTVVLKKKHRDPTHQPDTFKVTNLRMIKKASAVKLDKKPATPTTPTTPTKKKIASTSKYYSGSRGENGAKVTIRATYSQVYLEKQ